MKAIFFTTVLLSCMSWLHSQNLTLQPGLSDGFDTHSRSSEPAVNYGYSELIAVRTETISGEPFYSRAYLKFDLSSIPGNASITEAKLNIFADLSDSRTNVYQEDSLVINRITTSWVEDELTWNNAPDVDAQATAAIPLKDETHADYEFDVTEIVQNAIDNANSSFGFRIKFSREDPYELVLFASSENSNSNIRPKLTVTYSTGTGITREVIGNGLKIISNGTNLSIVTDGMPYDQMSLINANGQVVLKDAGRPSYDITGLPSGVYILQLANPSTGFLFTDKVILQ